MTTNGDWKRDQLIPESGQGRCRHAHLPRSSWESEYKTEHDSDQVTQSVQSRDVSYGRSQETCDCLPKELERDPSYTCHHEVCDEELGLQRESLKEIK